MPNTAPITIPGIEIDAELGRGAYSIVYRARRGTVACAVKVPRWTGRWTRWVYREAVALARVHDPGLPTVLEVGEEAGTPYLVMELVQGQTLAQRLARGRLTEHEAMDLAARLAQTLGAVHAAGLVHRDVKPQNVVLDGGGRVKLVDFGFAMPVERAANDVAGTPAYAAPEQLRAPTRVDGRADLFALGCVLFESLTGGAAQDPQRGPRAREHILRDLHAAGVREGAVAVVTHLLAADPAERYADAAALLADVERARDGIAPRGPELDGGERPQPSVFGRESELARLQAAWGAAREGAGATCVIEGPRGSGKTQLLRALTVWAHRRGDPRIVELRCRAGDPPLATVRRLLGALLAFGGPGGPTSTDRSGHLRRRIEDALRAAAESPSELASFLAPVVAEALGHATDTKVAEGREAFLDALADIVVPMVRRAGPTLVAIDDLERIDPASREVVIRVTRRAGDVPLLVVGAARGDALSAELGTLSPARLSVLALGPLDDADTARLAAAHLGEPTVEAVLVRRVSALAQGTPLGVLEVLGTFLDTGVLRPHWGKWKFDAAKSESIALPREALVLLGRRLEEVPAATRRVLQAATVIGGSFDDALLARVVEVEIEDLGFALAEAQRAGLLELGSAGHHRFVHDSLREGLLGELTAGDQRDLHQRVAEALDDGGGLDVDKLYLCAEHYAAGEIDRAPKRAHEVALAAAEAALELFDNETALRYYAVARQAAAKAGLPLGAPFYRSMGEAQLRVGALPESRASFEAALPLVTGRAERATILGRIAWVHQAQSDSARAFEVLARAFETLGARMPREGVGSTARTLVEVARAELRSLAPGAPLTPSARAEAEVLCDLLYQNGRLGTEHDKPMLLVQSILQMLETSKCLGPSRALARARAMFGVVLGTLGRAESSAREVAAAQQMAADVGDPATVALCLQFRSVAACWTGDFTGAIDLMRDLLDRYGQWVEVGEYCLVAGNAEVIEASRGRPREAWAWIERAVTKVRGSGWVPAAFSALLTHRARATLASLGREAELDPLLRGLGCEIPEVPAQGLLRIASWAPRARYFVEARELGSELEGLIHRFQGEGHRPRFAHPTVVEYYIAAGHARVELCLAAGPADRPRALRDLKAAASDLRTAAKLPLFRAHALLVDGWLAWLDGSARDARKLLAEADQIAADQSCPWVQHGVARALAHLLRGEGKNDAARDKARIAEVLAEEHGAVRRAAQVREEFGLAPSGAARGSARVSSQRSSRASRRQLTALLNLVRAPAPEGRLEEQAAAILDNLLRDLSADRGLLSFTPSARGVASGSSGLRAEGECPDPAGLLVTRGISRVPSSALDGFRHGALRRVQDSGEPWPPAEGHVSASLDLGPLPAASAAGPTGAAPGPLRVLVAPFFLFERPSGAVYLERNAGAADFTSEDRDMLVALAQQVPIALELSRLLEERSELDHSLRQTQRMEAIGQLAGGVARDFNGVLRSIESSLDALKAQAHLEDGTANELEAITQASLRASRLTRQLLAVSRHRPMLAAPCDLDATLVDLLPTLKQLVGAQIIVRLNLGEEPRVAETDSASLEQAIVNLVLYARDAMAFGGSLDIATGAAVLDEAAVARGAAAAGEHVSLSFTHTGEVMSPEVMVRVFEPIRSTKAGGGMGLGLATVYAFVKGSRGHVEVSSEAGVGTTFRLYLPRATGPVKPSLDPADRLD